MELEHYPLTNTSYAAMMSEVKLLKAAADNKIVDGESEEGFIFEKVEQEVAILEIEQLIDQVAYLLKDVSLLASVFEKLVYAYTTPLDIPESDVLKDMVILKNDMLQKDYLWDEYEFSDSFKNSDISKEEKKAGFTVIK